MEAKSKVKIVETKNCDADKLKKGETIPFDVLEKDTRAHIAGVITLGRFIFGLANEQFGKHDHTKLGENLPAFAETHMQKMSGKDYKSNPWWKIHHTGERHHLQDPEGVPSDVNLIDIIECVCDCTAAAEARNGVAPDVKISDEVLRKAVENTVKLLVDNLEVVKTGTEDYNEAMKILGIESGKDSALKLAGLDKGK